MVISKLWNFVKRHRRKFFYTGLFAAGGYALMRYLRWKIEEYQERQMAEAFSLARRQQHFDSNQRTYNATVLSLIPVLRETIMKEFDCEKLTDQLKQKPSNKVHLWSELKLLAFTRALSAVYGTSILLVTLRVQLNVIGGCIYARNQKEQPLTSQNSQVQQKYLEGIQYFLQNGIVDLMDCIRYSVEREMLSIPLKQLMTLGDVKTIVNGIRQGIEGPQIAGQQVSPFIEYIISAHEQQKDDLELSRLCSDTNEIMKGADFHKVLQATVEKGLQHFFVHINRVFVGAQQSNTEAQAIPLAKVIPPVSSVIHTICSDVINNYMQDMLTLAHVEEFGRHIYEAFCQPVAPS